MPVHKQHTTAPFSRKIFIRFRLLFRKYPLVPYLLRWVLICLILGLLIGSAAAFFLQTLQWVTTFREEHHWILFLLPAGGFLVGWLYNRYGKSVASGNNLLIDTILEPGKTIPFKMAPMVYAGTIITHLLGGSAGREGTALQMAGAIADQLHKPFKLSKEDRSTLLIAAVAAGFGAVFGTPLAGALFGIEFFLLGRLRYQALFPAVMAAVLADLVTRAWGVPHTHYPIGIVPSLSFSTLIFVLIAGILFGWCAALFSKAMDYCSTSFRKYIAYPPFRPVAGGLLILLFVWYSGTTKYIGLGIPAIVSAFDTTAMPYDFALKMLLTVITLSAGFKGGEVTPLFFIGATLGSALSLMIPLPHALLAGLGFVAVFAGATNTPLACTMMGIELFGMECGVYIALACVVAYLCSGNNSIYSSQQIDTPKHRLFGHLKGKRIQDL
ncbi:H(+)/Cl(-) exchange transporter ClcA [compost metagenome]